MTESNGPSAGKPAKNSMAPRLLLLGVVGLALAAVIHFDMDDYLTFESLRDHRQALMDWYEQNSLLAVVGFFFGYAAVVALSVPGAVWLTLAGGFLFGTVLATFVVVLAATVGALGIFLIARYALADFFHHKMGKAGQRMERGFRENALSYLLVLRLVPVFPFWLVNLVPAFLGVAAKTFVIGTFLGIIPATAVFSSIGSGLGEIFDAGEMPDLDIIFQPTILGPLIGLALLALLPVAFKKFKSSKGQQGPNRVN